MRGEASDLTAVHLARFGQAGDQDGAEDGACARHRPQASVGLRKGALGGQNCSDLRLDAPEVMLQHVEKACDFFTDPPVLHLLTRFRLAPISPTRSSRRATRSVQRR